MTIVAVSAAGWSTVADATTGDMIIQPQGGDVLISTASTPSGFDGITLAAGALHWVSQGDKASARAKTDGKVTVVAIAANYPGHAES